MAATLSLCLSVLVFTFANAQNQQCPQYCTTGSGCAQSLKCDGGCGTGTYVTTDTTSCQVCSVGNCGSCLSTETTKCLACGTGYEHADATARTSCIARPQHCSTQQDGTPQAVWNSTGNYCETCKRYTDCWDSQCMTVYTRSSTASGGACGQCAENCISCDIAGAGKCDQCKAGYFRASDYSSCTACADNCLTCHISGAAKCDVCGFGYAKQSDGTCLRNDCVDGCLCVVADANRCDTAMVGYRLNHDKTGARKCAANCRTCNTVPPGYCDTTGCENGYAYSQWTGQCHDGQ